MVQQWRPTSEGPRLPRCGNVQIPIQSPTLCLVYGSVFCLTCSLWFQYSQGDFSLLFDAQNINLWLTIRG